MLQNLKDGVAARRYDVVSFYDGNPKIGNETYASTYNNAKYLFSSLENKEKFDKSPDAYTPEYGGFCAIAMAEGKELRPNPKSWEIRDGKLYFFTKMLLGIIDAKKQWDKKPEELRTLADKAWTNMNT